MLARGPCKRGLSLFELTISVLIFGILAAIAMPKYAESILKFRSESAYRRIQQDIILAQRRSRQTNTACTITFSTSSDNYTISGLTSMDRPSATYTVALGQSPYQSDIVGLATSAQPNSSLTTLAIVFDRFGMPNQGASITISAGGVNRIIDVAPISGKVSLR